MTSRFRGLIASASLKLGAIAGVAGALAGFRGLIASASLKRRLGIGERPNGVQIPRLDCLGLIEAVQGNSSARKSDRIPRLDCLGLIEALYL